MNAQPPARKDLPTGYTRNSLQEALQRVLMRQGGTQSLFARHRAIRDGVDADTYAQRFERFDLEKKVGIVACIFGPNYAGDIGIVCRAYMDLCTKDAFQFSGA